jgi:hypothetical protein
VPGPDAQAAQALAGAEPCPHPESVKKAAIIVYPDEGKPTALCQVCYEHLHGFVAAAERGDRPEEQDVVATLVALGYTPDDSAEFWRNLPRGN